MGKNFEWHSVADGKLPESGQNILISTINYGTVVGYYDDLEDASSFIVPGAASQILHNEVVAWAYIPKCDIEKPATNFRLPTDKEFELLCKFFTKFDDKIQGRWFYDEDTGEKLFLPCDGYRSITTVIDVGSYGYYWSSAYHSSYGAHYFYFNSSTVCWTNRNFRFNGHSVRLVSDYPFEGAIHVAGLYWKPENEDGYYTWDEAMSKFNVKGN